MSVRIHVERLVLDGVGQNRVEAERTGATLRAELADLLVARPLMNASPAALHSAPPSMITLAGGGCDTIGRQLAAAVDSIVRAASRSGS
jgi:hypothetical protein